MLALRRLPGRCLAGVGADRCRTAYCEGGARSAPYPLSVMLRVHCVQLFYNLSDPGMEDLYEVESVTWGCG